MRKKRSEAKRRDADLTPGMVFPHCDPRVLHAPGECEFCDLHPDWQQLRERWGIAFTGHEARRLSWTVELPCPADLNRPGSYDRWPGNVAQPV